MKTFSACNATSPQMAANVGPGKLNPYFSRFVEHQVFR